MYRILALPTESLRKFCRFISEECSLSSLLLSIRIYRQFDWGGGSVHSGIGCGKKLP